MSSLILHQYSVSPFCEKVRAVLGFKGLAYHSVQVPMFPPKPDVVALTGGYRKTPVVQVGCDVYCDTRLILRLLDTLQPQPPLFPEGHGFTIGALAQWADQTLFATVTPFTFAPEALTRMIGDVPPEDLPAFVEDRGAMAKTARLKPLGRMAFDHMPAYLAQLNAQLTTGPYLITEAPTAADFAVYHNLWFLNRGRPELIAAYPALQAFLARIAALGHGQATELSSEQALATARAATPAPFAEPTLESPNGLAIGDRVRISAQDYGHEPTEGELVQLGVDEVVLRREDPRAGVVHVHFPRVGYQLKPAPPG